MTDVKRSGIRILVTGWRDWPAANCDQIWNILNETCLWLFKPGMPNWSVTVVHGGAAGADRWAKQWALVHSVPHEEYPADWKKHGRAAGAIRNTEMVALGASVCLGFPGPGSRGTWDCMRKAVEAGIPLRTRSWRKGITE